ncbi:transposase, partial [Myxococcota bacterium]|nr:transposase [Myxococcota bacterium]
CPSCGYVSRQNRSGIKFVCKCCGRRAHADWVGSSGVLRRSQDEHIQAEDHPRDVKQVLRERFRRKRDSSSGLGRCPPSSSPSPLGRRLTTGGSGSGSGTGTASNSMPTGSSGRF